MNIIAWFILFFSVYFTIDNTPVSHRDDLSPKDMVILNTRQPCPALRLKKFKIIQDIDIGGKIINWNNEYATIDINYNEEIITVKHPISCIKSLKNNQKYR